jgi:hypothetical protein
LFPSAQSIEITVELKYRIHPGLNERFSVVRHNLGCPPILVFLATVDGEFENVRSALVRRLDAILARDAHLSSSVIGSTTPTPSFAVREKPLLAEHIVLRGDAEVSHASLDHKSRASRILQSELKSFETANLETDPLVRVTVYPAPASQNKPTCQVALGEAVTTPDRNDADMEM